MSHTAEPLLRYLQSDVEVARRWQALSLAWEAWKTGYAEIRVQREGGPGTYDAKLYREGAVLFDRVQRTSAELNDALIKSSAGVRADTNARLNASLGLIAATALIGFMVLAIVGRWIARGVHTPLQDLQDTVARLRAGDDTARAATSGPAEISTLAEAVNELAEANTRARQVEHRVIQELRQIDTAKSEFVSNVSHELRTALTIIDGYLELLDDESHGELNAEQRGMLAVTRRNVARLRALIEDLLTLNRAEHNGTTLELIDIAAVVAAAVGDMGFNAANRDVSVELTKPADPVVILGDSGQLHRAVLNLVSNAVKFSERHGAVRVGVSVTAPNVTITVADDGMGIPKDDLDKLGSRFFRASNAVRGEVAGTGLGLRIVQTIVLNHQGLLTLTSEEGVGTTATLLLPLADADAQSDTEQDGPTGG